MFYYYNGPFSYPQRSRQELIDFIRKGFRIYHEFMSSSSPILEMSNAVNRKLMNYGHSSTSLWRCSSAVPPLQDPSSMPRTFTSSVQMGVGLSFHGSGPLSEPSCTRKALQLAHCLKQQLPSMACALMSRSFHSLSHCCVVASWIGYICSACICLRMASLHPSGICPGVLCFPMHGMRGSGGAIWYYDVITVLT